MRYRLSQIKINPLAVAGEDGGIDKELLLRQLKKSVINAIRKELKTAEHKENPVSVHDADVRNISIVRESVDARKKPYVKLVYTVDFDCNKVIPTDKNGSFDEAIVREYSISDAVGICLINGECISRKSAKNNHKAGNSDNAVGDKYLRPVVAGFGPCGIFAGLILAEAGLKPIILERGKSVDERVADVENFWKACEESDSAVPDPESNVQFGEGGAGTFSDGKLTTGIKDVRIRKVLREFVEAGAPEEILYRHKPHIGTDKLRDVVKNLRYKIESLGGEVRFGCRLEDILIEDGRLTGVKVADTTEKSLSFLTDNDSTIGNVYKSDSNSSEDKWKTLHTDSLILAIGHSARDTFRMMYNRGFDMKQKAFSIGIRVEHPQSMINDAQYGNPKLAKILGPADYKLSYRCRTEMKDNNPMQSGYGQECSTAGGTEGNPAGRGVYTFCMCPGGRVVNASTEPGTSVTNGMSNAARDGESANSAILVDVRTSDFAEVSGQKFSNDENFSNTHPLLGLEFQKRYEKLAWENRTHNGMARSTYGEFRRCYNDKPDGNSLCCRNEKNCMQMDKKQNSNAVRNSIPDFASLAILEAMPYFGRKIRGFDRDDVILTAVESRSSSPVKILRDEKLEAAINGQPVCGIIPAGEGPGYAGGIMSAAVDGIRAAEAIAKLCID